MQIVCQIIYGNIAQKKYFSMFFALSDESPSFVPRDSKITRRSNMPKIKDRMITSVGSKYPIGNLKVMY
jgi:hypothetical protein